LENKIWRRSFGFKTGEETKDWEEQPDEQHHSLYFTIDIVGLIK
jgi:hypothetical protein